jgi:hypothetical protein
MTHEASMPPHETTSRLNWWRVVFIHGITPLKVFSLTRAKPTNHDKILHKTFPIKFAHGFTLKGVDECILQHILGM